MELIRYANIRTGAVLSRKEAHQENYVAEYTALNLKSVSAEGYIDVDALEQYFACERLKADFFTRERDILLRLSAPYTAIWIGEHDIDLLVPAHFAIIRTKQKLLDSYYLYWWLSQNRRSFYRMASGGTMMGTISSGYIAALKINPPPIEQQRQIGEFLRLANQEQQLLTKLMAKKRLLADTMLTRLQQL